MTDPIVVGIDPSSRKLAAVATQGNNILKTSTYDLPEKRPYETCSMAFYWIHVLVHDLRGIDPWAPEPRATNRVYVFMEAPVLAPKAGAGSLIPQAQVSGVILAACGSQDVPAELVYIQDWKKLIVGNGNASKAEVALWCRKHWRILYRLVNGDQDLIDAGAINRYGARMVARLERMNPPVKRIRKASNGTGA